MGDPKPLSPALTIRVRDRAFFLDAESAKAMHRALPTGSMLQGLMDTLLNDGTVEFTVGPPAMRDVCPSEFAEVLRYASAPDAYALPAQADSDEAFRGSLARTFDYFGVDSKALRTMRQAGDACLGALSRAAFCALVYKMPGKLGWEDARDGDCGTEALERFLASEGAMSTLLRSTLALESDEDRAAVVRSIRERPAPWLTYALDPVTRRFGGTGAAGAAGADAR
jgi:hypothetical protein